MTDNPSTTQEGATFRAVLHPHPYLGPKGSVVIMLAVSAMSFGAGWIFLLLGIWPVLAFVVLFGLAIYGGYRLSFLLPQGHDEIELASDKLTLIRFDGRGDSKRFEFNPHWVRVQVVERPGGGTKLCLRSRGEELEFGQVLDDYERREFAEVLEDKLIAARAGRPL